MPAGSAMRHLFEAFRLEVWYDRRLNTATCRVTVAGDLIAGQRQAAERVLQHPPDGEGFHVPICVVPPEGLEPPTRGLGKGGVELVSWSLKLPAVHLVVCPSDV